MHEKEILGLLPHGSTNALTNMLSALSQTESQLSELITEENRNLAMACGFVNPDGITDVTGQIDISIDNPPSMNIDNIRSLSIDRALEMHQIDSLIKVAHYDVLDRELSWVSPNASVGFGLPSTIQAGRVEVTELMLQKTELQAQVIQKAENAYSQSQMALKSYALAKANEATLKERVDQLTDGLIKGLGVSVTDLQIALQDKMTGDNVLINATYTYYTAIGMLSRMLMDGPYLDIVDKVEPTYDNNNPQHTWSAKPNGGRP